MTSRQFDQLREDVTFGWRQLKGTPGFAIVAALMLALGVGANAAVFTVLKSVLLDALPYAESDRLIRVYARRLDSVEGRLPLSAGTIGDIAQRQHSFQSLAAFRDLAIDGVYGAENGARTVRIAWVEPSFFSTLGVQPLHGRTFTKDDAVNGLAPLTGGRLVPDTARAVVVSHKASQQLFGTPDIVGREVRIEGLLRTAIGVLPERFAAPMGDIDFFFAFDLGPVTSSAFAARGSYWLGLIGRLKPGVDQEAAQRDLGPIAEAIAREHPREEGNRRLAPMALRDAMTGDTRTPLLVLMTSAGLVLFIACANLAGAFLSRTISRRKELAVRIALGADRPRLVRQLLTESVMLALLGGAAGLALAYVALRSLAGVARPLLPAFANLSLDASALFITTLVALTTGVLFGIAPALSVDRAEPERALRDETRGTGESRHSSRLRGVLVAGQLALCVSLLVGAGLLARSLWAMTAAPLGFDPDRILGFTIRLPPRDYPSLEAVMRFHDVFLERVRALPGVDAAAAAAWMPTRILNRAGFRIPGVSRAEDPPEVTLYEVVSDDYFRALRVPVRQGRAFDQRDRVDAPPAIIINETLARRFWPQGNALGSRIRLLGDPNAPLAEIVGIVGDVRNDRTRSGGEPILYQSSRQAPWPFPTFLIRASGDPLALLNSIERELAQVNPGLAVQRPTTLEALLGEGLATRRLPVMLMIMFGVLALLVASVGVYAMFASMAAAREREFGLRMALGSRPEAIAGLVLRQGAGWMGAGLAGGAVGVLVVVRLVRDLLYQVEPFDPVTLAFAVAVLATCAMIALLVPVRRATKVDPTIALRAQ